MADDLLAMWETEARSDMRAADQRHHCRRVLKLIKAVRLYRMSHRAMQPYTSAEFASQAESALTEGEEVSRG